MIFIMMVMMIAFNAIPNRLEEHLLRWRPKAPLGREATELHESPFAHPDPTAGGAQ